MDLPHQYRLIQPRQPHHRGLGAGERPAPDPPATQPDQRERMLGVAAIPCFGEILPGWVGAGWSPQEVAFLPIIHQRWMPELSMISGTPLTSAWVAANWLLSHSGTSGTSLATSCWISA